MIEQVWIPILDLPKGTPTVFQCRLRLVRYLKHSRCGCGLPMLHPFLFFLVIIIITGSKPTLSGTQHSWHALLSQAVKSQPRFTQTDIGSGLTQTDTRGSLCGRGWSCGGSFNIEEIGKRLLSKDRVTVIDGGARTSQAALLSDISTSSTGRVFVSTSSPASHAEP